MKVVLGRHPIAKKYLDMNTSLGTWESAPWKPIITPATSGTATWARYN
ncbi:MAG: hypothetical protein JXA41_16160 [Deltaproteobacteria bacterium]|nr:hypothetical protein [Deltaproteobacteria bacterium]